VVGEFSEGSSKSAAGELGWVTKDQVVPELAKALFQDAQVQKNQIIESSIGFHIVEIESKKKQGDVDVLKLRQIFVSKNSFADWLTKQKQQMRVFVPLGEFVWDKAAGAIDFSSKEMQIFEKQQRAQAEGGAGLLL
jgi:hypothetical protein